jgi:2-keto-4-pentenoate hydratase/2-oxohepta-3-ene-1,7-dioic acid hydratase in catechol pathway
MKLVSFRHAGRTGFGVVSGEGVIDLAPIANEAGSTLREALERRTFGQIAEWASARSPDIPLDAIDFLPVVPEPRKILCIGINYRSHVEETGREIPAHPMVFTRFADSQTGHRQPLVRPRASTKLDFEGELAVIIGRPARHVSAELALDHVAGYACYNDGSVRDWQRHTIQFTPGKNFPQTGGFGPWLVTSDDIPDPSKLALTTRLNGEVVQHASTDDLIFPVARLIAYCSTFTTLYPGDVIVTGTPGGVGAFREPPLWLEPGAIVDVEISGIGVLRNEVIDET